MAYSYITYDNNCFKCYSFERKLKLIYFKLFNLRMLHNFLSTFWFHRFCQSGMYFDYFYKKISEVFVRNIFIYMAQFFGEKFMIEFWTKKFIDSIIFNNNKFLSWTNLSYKWFFLQLLYVSMYVLILINIFFILF